MSEEHTSGSYQMEMLKASNWMPWKRWMLVVLWDLGLEKYIAADAKLPEPADISKLTAAKIEAQTKWREGDTKACTWIELAISDAEMMHISGATTAHEIWNQLSLVKESKGQLGVLATHRALYRATAEEGFNMINHISYLQKIQEELHLMDNKVTDEDFVMILITSLPESCNTLQSPNLSNWNSLESSKLRYKKWHW